MKRLLAFAALPAILLASPPALPCGAAFGPSIRIDPKQDIILVWKDNVETYVFQPIFCGSSTDFGLILPVPGPLSQQPTTTDTQAFTKAAALSEPTKKQVVQSHSAGCAAGGTELKAGGGDMPAVVASGQVGLLDWVQLKADTVASFTDWLDANGYPYAGVAASAFSYYVDKGWYFVAFRISKEVVATAEIICSPLGPIALSFATPEPVVPSRMASAGAGSAYFSWRIFGVTHGDVQLTFADPAEPSRKLWYSGAIPAADVPAFAGLAAAGDRLTRLTLSFYGSSVEGDAAMTVVPAFDYRGTEEVYVVDDSACSVGHDGGSTTGSLPLGLSVLALLGLAGWRRRR